MKIKIEEIKKKIMQLIYNIRNNDLYFFQYFLFH